MTVGQMDASMTVEEINHWKALYTLEEEERQHDAKRRGG